jgi:Zn-dependent metalloprotease
MTRLLVGLVSGLLFLGANAATPIDLNEQIADLKARNVRIKTDPNTGAVRLIGAWPQAPLMVPSVNEATRPDFAAMEAVKHFGPMFGLARPEQEMRLVGERTKPRGGSSHRYRQHHKGIPVLTGELLVNLDNYSRVISMSGEISSDLDVDARADVSASEARRLALETIAKWYNLRKRPLRASVPELWIVDPKILKPGDRDASLTWRIEVTDKQEPHGIRELLYIDANTAGITLHINLIETAKNRATYTANNTSSLPGALVCDESDPDCVAGDTEARNAHQFAGDTYDFYFDEHGRDSLDDAGQTLTSTVNYSDGLCPNAFWNGTQMVYCTGLAVDDVVGHELTHGITEKTSALLYYYQSGAINESLSDVWGEFVDLGNSAGDDSPAARWLIGEDLTNSIGVIRDMADPPAMGDPDRMSSPYYFASSGDNGGVHFNLQRLHSHRYGVWQGRRHLL